MRSGTLYDSLEVCLTALDQGVDVETCLARFPAQAQELRPILQAALQVRSSAVTEVPDEVVRRGRARVLQAAAELRERNLPAPGRVPALRLFRLAFSALVVMIFVLTGGTSLVRAASGSLPGDQLYPVKRSWEDLNLWLTFDAQARQQLETRYEQEREGEIIELFGADRAEQVSIKGTVQIRADGLVTVGGIPVVWGSSQTDGEWLPGAYVEIEGETGDDKLEAARVTLLATPTSPRFQPVTTQPEPQETQSSQDSPSSEPSETELDDSPSFLSTLVSGYTSTPVSQLQLTNTPRPASTDSGSYSGSTGTSGTGSGSNSGQAIEKNTPGPGSAPEDASTPNPPDDSGKSDDD